jgi:hypothetical protein
VRRYSCVWEEVKQTSLRLEHTALCQSVGSTLDVKKSSHKKMSKFLQVCC